MPSSNSNWTVPFHAAKYPRENRIPLDSVKPTEVTPLIFPEVQPTRRLVNAPAEEPSIEAVQRELEARLESATQEAFQEGYARAKEEADAGLDTLREQTKGAFDAFRKALDRSEKDSTRDAISLAILLAEQVLRTKLTADVESAMAALEPAVGALEGMEPLTIMCDPATGELLRANLGVLQERLEVAGVQVEVDESFEPGDAVLQRGASTLDARVEGRLAKLRDILFEQLGLESGANA